MSIGRQGNYNLFLNIKNGENLAEEYKRKMGYIYAKSNNRFLQIVLELENKLLLARINDNENKPQSNENESYDVDDFGEEQNSRHI